MRKKIALILTLITLGCALALIGLACAADPIDELREQGYYVSVTYDANGGNFGEPGLTVMQDYFRPADYEADEDGIVRIKVQDIASERVNGQGTKFTTSVVNDLHGFWGWYRTRTPHVEDGNIVDESGNLLEEVVAEDGEIYYYIKGTDKESTPLYEYSDRWNFDEDYIEYDTNSEDIYLDVTLYAVWIPYFEFDYYYIDEATGKEILYATTSFDYVASLGGDGSDCVILPVYPEEGGAMVYRQLIASGTAYYTFPSRDGYTFSSAYYYDESGDKTPISGSLRHGGYVDENTTLPVNSVMKIYVEFDEGTVYEIKTAAQFRQYASASAVFIICNDLDFNCDSDGNALRAEDDNVVWPASLDNNVFTGKIYSEDGDTKTLSNIYVNHTTGTATYGGLFGCIGAGAVIKNIEFSTVTYNFSSLNMRTTYGSYALFAGDIEKGATLENVSLTGDLTFKIGNLSSDDASNSLNVISNADGWEDMLTLDASSVKVTVYTPNSVTIYDTYRYTVVVGSVAVDEGTGHITYSISSSATDEYTYVDEDGEEHTGNYTEKSYDVVVWKAAE